MRTPTNWDTYETDPHSFFIKHFFLNSVVKAYSDLFKEVRFKKPVAVLEFGCGTGYIDKWFCETYNVEKVTVIDLNQKILNIARDTLANSKCETEFINMDFFEFSSGGQYDIVHSQGVIEHFETKKRYELLKKHCEATKIDGYCAIYFPTPSRPYIFFRKIAEFVGMWKFADEVPLKSEIVIKEMESLGFEIIKSNFFWKYFLTEAGVLFKKNG